MHHGLLGTYSRACISKLTDSHGDRPGLPPRRVLLESAFLGPWKAHQPCGQVSCKRSTRTARVLCCGGTIFNGTKPSVVLIFQPKMAHSLIEMVLARYQDERKQLPQRVIIHKSSRFETAEREGFESALSRVSAYDLVALTPVSEVRLVRAGQYPPLRGTGFGIGLDSYLYTSGYLELLGKYPHGHVPSPLQITDHVGDTARSQLLREVLVLTKMNWNSANFAGLLPITLRFSRLVGDILREVPEDQQPQPKYKYYM